MENALKSCRTEAWCYMNGVITPTKEWDTVLELEGYLDTNENKEELDYLFLDFQLLGNLNSVADQNLVVDKINNAREVFITAVHVACNLTGSLRTDLIPAFWPNREYKLIHQVHHLDSKRLPLPNNITPVFYDLHLTHFKSLIQKFPYKANYVWLREGKFYDVWRLAEMAPYNMRKKIFLVPNRYGFHKSRALVKTIIEESRLFSGYYSALDRTKMHDDDPPPMTQHGSYLLGMLNDPLIYNHHKFIPYENRIDIGDRSSIPVKAVFDDNNNRWISTNLIHVGYYENTFVSVCCESVENDDCIITEKTLMPLAHGHFILPIGAPGIVKALKSKGFVFPDFIDYSYDSIDDIDARIEKFGEEFKRLIKIELDHWRDLHNKNIDLLHHNRQVFFRPYDKLGL